MRGDKFNLEKVNKRKFLIVIDDFDKTFLQKNVGLFAKYLASCNINVWIVTNATFRNKGLVMPEGITIVRLDVDDSKWPPLDHPAFYEFINTRIVDFFAVWFYRGRPYSLPIIEAAKKNNVVTIIKLDSSGGLSIFTRIIRILVKAKILPGEFPTEVNKYLKPFSRLGVFRWYFKFDTILARSDLVICESDFLFNKMGLFFGEDKAFLYPNSIPVKEYKQEENLFKSKGLKKENVILSVGRIIYGKGFENTIRAFSMLPDKLKKEWELRIVGPVYDDNYVNLLKKLVKKLGLSKHVHFVGELYGESLHKEYFKSKIMFMVYPKTRGTMGYEGQPNVIVEAMFFGSAVVTVDVGTVSYLVSDWESGRVLPLDDPKAASKTLEEIIVNEGIREKFTMKARHNVEENFNLNRNGKRLLDKTLELEYRYYLKDQKEDVLAGSEMRRIIYKYCDFLREKLLRGIDYKKATIIDIGCREFFTYDYFLNKIGAKILGIDIGVDSLKSTRSKGVIDLDAHRLSEHFAPNSFDLILAFHSFEHMYNLEEVLIGCHHILKRRGYLYFAIPMPAKNARRAHWFDIENEEKMIRMCESAGFEMKFVNTFTKGAFRGETEMLGLFVKS